MGQHVPSPAKQQASCYSIVLLLASPSTATVYTSTGAVVLAVAPPAACRAMCRGAAVPRLDPQHGRPCYVTGQRSGRRHVSLLAAPPCMARHRHFVAP